MSETQVETRPPEPPPAPPEIPRSTEQSEHQSGADSRSADEARSNASRPEAHQSTNDAAATEFAKAQEATQDAAQQPAQGERPAPAEGIEPPNSPADGLYTQPSPEFQQQLDDFSATKADAAASTIDVDKVNSAGTAAIETPATAETPTAAAETPTETADTAQAAHEATDEAAKAEFDEATVRQAADTAGDATTQLDDMGDKGQANRPDLAEPTRPADSFLAAGDPVYHGENSTAVGYDSNTLSNFDKVEPLPGYHDVVVHGASEGMFTPGAATTDGGMAFTETHPAQIAEAIRENPNYNGEPIRLVSCNSGVSTSPDDLPAAHQLANELGVEVMAPNDKVGIVHDPSGASQPLQINRGGEWLTFPPAAEMTGDQ